MTAIPTPARSSWSYGHRRLCTDLIEFELWDEVDRLAPYGIFDSHGDNEAELRRRAAIKAALSSAGLLLALVILVPLAPGWEAVK